MQPTVSALSGDTKPLNASSTAASDQLQKLRAVGRIGAALAAETDLQLLLDGIVEQAALIADAPSAALLLIVAGEQGMEVRAEWDKVEGARLRCILDRSGPIRQALVSGKPVVSKAHAANEASIRDNPSEGTQITIPLLYKDRSMGVLEVKGAASPDIEQDKDLLITLASYAATAVYASRLNKQQQDHALALRDLQRHSISVVSRTSEAEILQEAARVIARLLETDCVAIFLHDPDTVGLRLGGASCAVSPNLEALADTIHPGAIPAGYTNGLLFLSDVKTSSYLPAPIRAAVVAESISAVLSFAVGNEQLAGLGLVLAAFEERPSLEAHQLELAFLYANQVSVAIHTLRLSQQASQTAREQAALFAITEALHAGGEAEVIGQRLLDTLALALRASGGCLLMGDLAEGGLGSHSANGLQLVQTGTPHGQIEYYVAMVASGLADEEVPLDGAEDWHALFARLETRFGLAGMLSLWRQPDATRFTAREEELITTVSNELARHLENRALIARELAVISDVEQASGASQISEVAARVAQQAWGLAHAEGAAILLFDEDNDALRVEAEFGELPDLRPLEGPNNLAYLSKLREPLMLFAGDYEQFGAAQPLEGDESGGQHLLLVPLHHDDQQVGVMMFAYSDALKYRSRLPFIQALSQRAAVVLRNLQLQIDAEQLAMLEERNRIARTMHDGLAQQLAQIRFRTELVKRLVRDDPDRALRELGNIQEELKKGIGGIRRTINSLEPVMMKKLGFKLALMKLGEDFSEDSSNPVSMTVEGDMPERSLQAQLAVFRLAQEALSSMINLHEAGDCCCNVLVEGDEVQVLVSHNGEPRVDGVDELIREQLLALVRSRNGGVEVANRDGKLVARATMRLRGDGAPRSSALSGSTQ